MQPGARTDDPAAVADLDAAVAFRINRRQRPRTRHRQPQPQQMAFAFRLRPIDEARAVVQQRMVMHELDVARLERDVQPQFLVLGQLVKAVQRGEILLGQLPRLGEAMPPNGYRCRNKSPTDNPGNR